MHPLKNIIDIAFEKRFEINYKNVDLLTKNSINEIISNLNSGKLRASKKINGIWTTNSTVKKAILLYFSIKKTKLYKNNISCFFDKIPTKFDNWTYENFKSSRIRISPSAVSRYGAYIGKNVILMPSFINIGSYIGNGTMIDTWTTVGSCAQIGENVHLSGGVGIGGVLEPIQCNPTIIEDNCFIGARSEIVEGVIIEHGSIISMGVFIGQSTKIYDRKTGIIYYGKVPPYSVVVPGTLPDKNKKCNLYCAIIVKKVDSKTLSKTDINKLLRTL
ncbi:MAG: 2,3,4,5-tetrahydropyridine-2,6-dicarboxylate N-succinyltransferase [Enterobacterales bacterium]